MIVSRRYLLIMLTVTVAALAYLGIAHTHTAHKHQQAKRRAAAAAAQQAHNLAIENQTAAVLARVHLPASFNSATRTTDPECLPESYDLCAFTSQSPATAMVPAMTAMRAAGLRPQAVTCKAPPFNPAVDAAMGTRWRPCHVMVKTDSSLSLNLVAFPSLVQHPKGWKGAPTFNGSVISVIAAASEATTGAAS